MAKSILVLYRDLSILTDNSAINSANQIRDAYTSQYKKNEFVLCFILFTYFVITKAALLILITIYNIDF